MHVALREGNADPFGVESFFDLARDPYQLQNLAGDNTHADMALDLDVRLREWDTSTPWMPAPGG